MQGSKKIPINDLNPHITCQICSGYFIDATTITECLHTFCRSCIVKYLESNKYCPVCDVQVHKTKPLLNIRADKTIQDIVYKLVPRLFQNEMQRRRDFYESHPEGKPSSLEMCGEAAYQHLLTPEESVCLTLNYHGSNSTPRYLRCPAAVSLGHLKKLIRAKYDLTENHRVEILYNQDCLNSFLTLMDVAYIYMWKRKGPLELTYRIYECSAKKLKLEPEQAESAQANINNNNWKEVQLRISETGEMSIIQDAALSPSILEIVNSDQQKYKNEVVTVVESKSAGKGAPPKKELPGLKYIGKNANVPTPPVPVTSPKTVESDVKLNDVAAAPVISENAPVCAPQESLRLETSSVDVTAPSFLSSCATLSSGTTTMVFSTINSTKCSTKSDEVPKNEPARVEATKTDKVVAIEPPRSEEPKSPSVVNNIGDRSLKRKGEAATEVEPPAKLPKPTILNHSLGLLNLSNNHPLKKHSKLNRNGENVKEIVLRASTPALEPAVSVSPLPTTKPPTTTTKTVTATTTTDSTFSKPSLINKNLTAAQLTRPGTPIATTKPSIMSTKPSSIIPPKPPISVYSSCTVKSPCYMPKTTYNPIINVPKPVTSTSIVKNETKPPKNDAKTPAGSSMPKIDGKCGNAATSQQPQQQIINLNNKMGVKSKPSSPIGYKTLRDPPKSWNSQISKANINKPSPDPKYSELKNVRPAKFFKMRNNMPRYLGNPASGVKPMYQVHISPEKDKGQETNKLEKSEIRKHSIVKIDPKTLKPISEKAPETTSLSNHSSNANQILSNHNLTSQAYQNLNSAVAANQSLQNSNLGLSGQSMGGSNQTDLKINASSVSIFNPLKLQSSPKNERKSPKSPHSPKLKAQATSSPTGSKRDKVNLNFTPPNPFVPNLTSPTMSPNQFLYPPGPPGFPSYDPRMMAAYHSLWYGQRMGFPASPIPRLSLDLNQQRKNFEMMPSPTSPKMAGMSQQGHSPQISTKMASTTSSSVASATKTQSLLPSAAPKSSLPSKKSSKESKGEKSLETTVEKLTQSRNKEISGKSEQAHSTVKEKTKRLESPEVRKGNETPGEKTSGRAESKAKENETSESNSSSSSSTIAAAAPVEEKTKPPGDQRQSEEVKSSESPWKAEGDCDAVSKKSPSEEAAGSSVRSKDLSNNVNNVKNSDEVVEGGK